MSKLNICLPVDISGTVVGESPDCLLLSGTVVSGNLDHVCWAVSHNSVLDFMDLRSNRWSSILLSDPSLVAPGV